MDAAIKTERLTKTYGKNRGIRDVDLEVAEGEVFGFLGSNSAGKTTIRTLPGFMRPTAEDFALDAQREGVEVRARDRNLPDKFALAPSRQLPVAAALPGPPEGPVSFRRRTQLSPRRLDRRRCPNPL